MYADDSGRIGTATTAEAVSCDATAPTVTPEGRSSWATVFPV